MTINLSEDTYRYCLDYNRYCSMKIPKEDIEVWLDYFKHRLKTSKKRYIDLWRSSMYRNKKFYNMLSNADDYSGCCLSREALQETIEVIEQTIMGVNIDKKYLVNKSVRDLIRILNRVGA